MILTAFTDDDILQSGRSFPVAHEASRTKSGARAGTLGVALVVLLAVALDAGVIHAAHRDRQKAAEIGAAFNIDQSVSDVPPAGQVPIVPAAATGNQANDWALPYERTAGGPEADLVVHTGDIDNLGFGFPEGFDPFSGEATPPHGYPWEPPPSSADETDRIMLGSAVTKKDLDASGFGSRDGYSAILDACRPSPIPGAPPCRERQESMPRPIVLDVGALPARIDAVLFQIFADDFQAPVLRSRFQVSVNGTRIPSFEDAMNALNQTGPIGKLMTLKLLPEYWPLLRAGTVKLLIDDPTTRVGDGYAVDFVRILVNPHQFRYQVTMAATVVDAATRRPISGATVTAVLASATTDPQGQCELAGLPAGLVIATAIAPGYDANSVQVDLPAGQRGKPKSSCARTMKAPARWSAPSPRPARQRSMGSTSTPTRQS